MSDQVNDPNKGTEIPGEAPQYTETERTAIEQGWMPLDKWTEAGRDPSEHRSAREFKDRGELLKRIQDQNKYISQLSGSFETLRQHNVRTFEAAYKKAVEDLRAEHKAAVNEGDIARADKVLDKLEEERNNFQQAKAAQQQAASTSQVDSPEVTAWKDANPWYTEDEDLRQAANSFGYAFAQQRQGKVTAEEILQHVSKKMAKFIAPKIPVVDDGAPQPKFTAPNPVGGARTSVRPGAASVPGLREGELSEDETKAMKDFVKYGLGTKADYLKQLKEIRG